MKLLWTVISTLAVANVLAIVGLILWLNSSGRLNGDRISAVRKVFATTIAEDKAAEKAKADEVVVEAAKRAETEKTQRPPTPAAEKIAAKVEGEEIKLQNLHRRESDIRALQQFLQRENDRLQQWQKNLERREAEFAARRKAIEETAGSEQFQRALATLSGLKAPEAQALLNQLVQEGKFDETVSYLDAIEDRLRSRIIAEFQKGDPALAARLLEALRTRALPEEHARPEIPPSDSAPPVSQPATRAQSAPIGPGDRGS